MAETLDYDPPLVPVLVEVLEKDRKMENETSEVSEMGSKKECSSRAEIDTSAPFESVKEAVTRFGGLGYWKPSHHKLLEPHQYDTEEVDIAKLEEQASQLEKYLILKESETLGVLKELESTKTMVEELKSRLQKEASEFSVALDTNMGYQKMEKEEDKENLVQVSSFCPPLTSGSILKELNQATSNLTRTSNNISDIQASVESFNKKLDKDKRSLEKTCERLTLDSLKLSSLENELNQTRLKLQGEEKDATVEGGSCTNKPLHILEELQRLSSEVEQFKKMGEIANSEVSRTIFEIEQTRAKIKTAGMRLLAAKKIKGVARAEEAIAFAEIKDLSNHERSPSGGVTLQFEELLAGEANMTKAEMLKWVVEASEQVKSSRKALGKALNMVESANGGKLAVEEALGRWRCAHRKKRRNSAKFKRNHPCPPHHSRRDSHPVDHVNELNVVMDISAPAVEPILSIGQILRRKLLNLHEESESGMVMMARRESCLKRHVSLAHMLSKHKIDFNSSNKAKKQEQISGKRKKSGFARLLLVLTKESSKMMMMPNLSG